MSVKKSLATLITLLVATSCTVAQTETPSTSPTAAITTATPPPAPAPTSPVPQIPAPVAVEILVKGAALLVLDITNTICDPRPSCVASIPKIANLVKKVRDAKVPVIYSLTATAGTAVRAEIAPQSGDPTVTGRADKFYATNLEQILKDRGVENAVIVGSAANGAVLYTTFGANVRSLTVVVAQDGISAEPEFPITLTRWQLLNEPGFANPDNKPLAKGQVTLSTTDLITFK
jgi:nicotinamidase-related amidase